MRRNGAVRIIVRSAIAVVVLLALCGGALNGLRLRVLGQLSPSFVVVQALLGSASAMIVAMGCAVLRRRHPRGESRRRAYSAGLGVAMGWGAYAVGYLLLPSTPGLDQFLTDGLDGTVLTALGLACLFGVIGWTAISAIAAKRRTRQDPGGADDSALTGPNRTETR